jgi:hypothetical protein
MKKIIVPALLLCAIFIHPATCLAQSDALNGSKNTLNTRVFSNNQELKRGLKFPFFSSLSSYTRPAVFSIKRANRALVVSFRKTPLVFNEKILPVYGFSSYVSASSKTSDSSFKK